MTSKRYNMTRWMPTDSFNIVDRGEKNSKAVTDAGESCLTTEKGRNGAPAKRTTLSRAHFCCKFLPLGVSALMDFAYLFVTYETIKTFYFNSFQNVQVTAGVMRPIRCELGESGVKRTTGAK